MLPVQLKLAIQSTDLSRPPYYADAMEFAVLGITPAQVNAGYYLVLPQHMLRLVVTGIFLRVNSAAIGALTTLEIRTDEATPVVIASAAQANLGSGVRLNEASTNTVLGAGFATALQQGAGIKIAKGTGDADATGAFTVDVILRMTAK